MQPKKVEVEPNVVIAHDDANAICTKDGWHRWQEWLTVYRNSNTGTAFNLANLYGPYRLQDNRRAPGS